MAIDKLDLSLLDEEIKRQQEEKITISPDKISDSDLDLFKKVFTKQMEDEGADENTLKLFKAADDKIAKELYSNTFKSVLKDADVSRSNQTDLLNDWHKQLNISARQLGVIDRLDDKSLDLILKEQTFDQPHQKYGLKEGLLMGWQNQIEGVKFAGIAAVAALKGDPGYYAKKAGGTMAENYENAKWSEVLTDLMWLGDTGSERGGKMFSADLVFLFTSPIKVPVRMALGMATKATLKQGTKTIMKNATKNMAKEAIEAAVKKGARLELKGIGAKALEKDINKLAWERTRAQVKEAGKKAVKDLPMDLFNSNKASIITEGLSSSYKIQSALKNTIKGGLDLVNIPLGINTREIIKGTMGYGIPVLAGASETVADVSSYFTQSGNKLVQLYAQNNVTQYEKQLAMEFTDMTGADPLSDDFNNKESWEAYKSFKIRNEGLGTLMLGKKEGWGRFWNFFAESAVNMVGMSIGVKGMTKAGDALGNKLTLTGTADLTKSINDLKNSERFKGKLDLEPLKEDLDAFKKEVDAIKFKTTAAETVKLTNRANDLVESIYKKSADVTVNNPTLAAKIVALKDKLTDGEGSYKKFDKAELPKRLKEIELSMKEIIGEIEVGVDRFNIFRETAELTKIVEYFKELEEQKDFSSRLKLAVAKNLGKGSSTEVRTYLGGLSTAEAFASKNPFLADYFLQKVLSTGEMAKMIAFDKELDLKNLQFVTEIAKISSGEISESGFMKKIVGTVDDMVGEYFKGGSKEHNQKISNALVNEGIVKSLEVYNSLNTGQLKSKLDFAEVVKHVLGEDFGEKIINTAAGIKNTTVSKFLKSAESMDSKQLDKLIKKSFEASDSIFNPKSEEAKLLTERYNKIGAEARKKIRPLAEAQKRAYDVFHRDLKALEELKLSDEKNNLFGIREPIFNGLNYDYGSKQFKTYNGALNAFTKDLQTKAIELNKEALNDPNHVKNILTPEDVENFAKDRFHKIVEAEQASKLMLEENTQHVMNAVASIFEKNNPEHFKDNEISENVKNQVSEDGAEPINTADKAVNNFIADLQKLSPVGDKLIVSKDFKLSDLVKMTKVASGVIANLAKVEKGEGINKKLSSVNKELTKIKAKIDKANTFKDVTNSSIELINKVITDIEIEINKSNKTNGDIDILKARLDNLNETKLSLSKAAESAPNKNEAGRIEVTKNLLLDQIDIVDKNIDKIRDLSMQVSRALDVKKEQITLVKGIDKSKATLIKKLSNLNKEQEALSIQRDSLVDELYKKPLDKKYLSEIARNSPDVDSFYKNIKKEWTEAFGEEVRFPDEIMNKKSTGYKAIYNTLKQTTDSYKNPEFAGPRETVIIKLDISKSASKLSPYDLEMSFGQTSPRQTNGSKFIIPRVEGVLHKQADKFGFKIVESVAFEYGGKNISLGELFSQAIKDEGLMEKYSKPENTPKLTTNQQKAAYSVAENISNKALIGILTNEVEKMNLITSSDIKFDTPEGKAYLVQSKKSSLAYALLQQLNLDGEINKAGVNMIYKKVIEPAMNQARQQGYTFLGSIDELGKRLYFTPTKNGDVNKTFDDFIKKVTSIDPNKVGDKKGPLRRIKNIAAGDIHADQKAVNEYFKNAKYDRAVDSDGNSMFRAIFIDDDKYNKHTIKIDDFQKEYTTTDGQAYLSQFLMHILNKEIGLHPDMAIKGSAFIPGEQSFVLKMMGLELRQSEANKTYFNNIEKIAGTRDINQLQSMYDMYITRSAAKSLNLDFKEGDVIDIPVENFVVKRLDNRLKNETSGAMQVFSSISRIMSGDPEHTILFDKAMTQIAEKVFNPEFKEFAEVLQAINLNKPGLVDILQKSRIFKDISGDDYMSRIINDLRNNGGLKNLNKSAFENHVMSVFRDRIARVKFAGTEAHLMGIGDYGSLERAVVNNYKQFGVNENNFIILSKKHYENRVYKNKNGLPEVFTYKYPVTKPSNLAVLKVIWAEDAAVKDIVGDIGNKALSNMYNVFVRNDADFDIDKVNIVNDPRLKGDFLDLVKRINKSKEFNFGVDITGKEMDFQDMFKHAINPTSDKLSDKVLPGLREDLKPKSDYFSFLNKIKSKHAKMSVNEMIDHFVEGRERIHQETRLTSNSSSGKTLIERIYMLDGIDKLSRSKININSNVERMSTAYADSYIIKNISAKNIKTSPTIIKFNKINSKLAAELAPIYKQIKTFEAPTDPKLADKVEVVVRKGTHGNIISLNDNYDVNRIELSYHQDVLNKIKNDVKLERNKLADGYKSRFNKKGNDWTGEKEAALWAEIKEKTGAENIVQGRINDIEKEISHAKAARKETLNKYEQEAILKVKPDLSTGENAKDLQRYIAAQKWGSDKKNNAYNSKAFFLLSPEIHKEYNNLYSEKYLSRDLNNSFGIDISEKDTQIIKVEYNKLEALKESGASFEDIAAAKDAINLKISEMVEGKISESKISDRPLVIGDVREAGRFSSVLEEILFQDKDGKPFGDNEPTRLRLKDLYDIKETSDILIREGADNIGILVNNLDKNKSYLMSLRDDIKILDRKIAKSMSSNETKKLRESMALKQEEFKLKSSEIIVGAYASSIALSRTHVEVASQSSKNKDAFKPLINEAQRKTDSSLSKAKEVDKVVDSLKSEINKNDTISQMLNEIQEQSKIIGLLIERIASEEGKTRLYAENAEKTRDIVQRAFAKLMINTTDNMAKSKANSIMKNFDAANEMKKLSMEINKDLTKLYETEPTDMLSQIFETVTKTYKNFAVGLMAGRAINEGINTALIFFTEKMAHLSKGGYGDDQFKQKFKNIGDINIPTPKKLNDNFFQDFALKQMGEVSSVHKYKILENFNNTLSRAAGFVSSKFVNWGPNKLANKYYELKFREGLYNEASKNDGIHRQKTYLLKDPSKLSWQDRQQYNSTIRYIESAAKHETEKAFFNYDMNPLLVHKLENALPFSNFMFSGFRLMKMHPRSILGANVLFNAAINNFGDQVGFVMDDENGDPVRIDYGKRIKLPLLGLYGGASINLDRLLQFSPSDTGLGVAPVFAYMTGDTDWRVKKWLNGEMSGLELALGAISPSISQLASGIIEDDYQKRMSGLSYMMTGFASKSSAHAKIANDFYIKQDYEAVKNAPGSVKRHLFEQFNNKNKDSGIDESTLDSLIEAKKLGLIGDPLDRNKFGIYEREDAFKEAIKVNGMMLSLAANGTKDPSVTEEDYKKLGRDIFEFNKWVAGSDFFKKTSDPDWLEKVEEFVKAGHLENFKKVNKSYAEAMEHFYNNKDYHLAMRENNSIAYGVNSSADEQLRAKAKLLALKYEIAGAGSTVDSKAYALLNGTAQFIVDENGVPEMTKERMADIDYRGRFVAEYEETVSNHEMQRDTMNLYYSMYAKAKESGDKKLKDYSWGMAQHNKALMTASYKKLKEEHSIEADIYNLKRITEGKKPAAEIEDSNGNKLYVTQPITKFMEKRTQNINEFYNEIASNRKKFIENNKKTWTQFTNQEQSVFMALNNGKTLNQAKADLDLDEKFFDGLIDSEIPKRTTTNINLIKQLLYE